MSTTTRRQEFLTDILTGAVENGGHGWFVVHEYVWEDTTEPYAVIEEDGDTDNETFRVDLGVIRKGLHVIGQAEMRELTEGHDAGTSVLHNAKTGQRLYLAASRRAEILKASRTNGEDGDLDVLDYLAIVECALFGAVTYG
jgi:hypothetical protein